MAVFLSVGPTIATQALAQTAVGIQPSFAPARLGASTAFTLALRLGAGSGRVPPPLSGIVLRLPVGLSLQLAGVPTCSLSSLRKRGAAGCPTGSLLGRGDALLKVHAGSQTLPEQATVSLLRTPDEHGEPSFEILGHGETPLDESTLSHAVLQPDGSPYGSQLIVTVPPIPTLTYEPNASFSSLSLTIGSADRQTGVAGAVTVPRNCPRGGFPFAASFMFADQSTASAGAKLPCP